MLHAEIRGAYGWDQAARCYMRKHGVELCGGLPTASGRYLLINGLETEQLCLLRGSD